MPALDIIGYLWMKREALAIETLPAAVSFAADLMTGGLDCVQVKDVKVLGQVIGVSTSYPRKTEEEWDGLVSAAIVDAAVAHTVHMMSDREDDDE